MLSWNEDKEEDKGLKIVILKHVFTLEEAANMERGMLKLYKEFGIKY